MSYDEWDIALIIVLLTLLLVCIAAIWVGSKHTRNCYNGLPQPKHDERSSVDLFKRMHRRG